METTVMGVIQDLGFRVSKNQRSLSGVIQIRTGVFFGFRYPPRLETHCKGFSKRTAFRGGGGFECRCL